MGKETAATNDPAADFEPASSESSPAVRRRWYNIFPAYATIGYGDLVLPKESRLFGPIEGLTGILMCGLSTAFLFVIVSKRILQRMGGKEPSQPL